MKHRVISTLCSVLSGLVIAVPVMAQGRAPAAAPAAGPAAFPASQGIRRIGHSPRSAVNTAGERINSATNSDLAFWGGYAFQGSYDGFRVVDISNPRAPKQVAQVNCSGTQGDVMVWNKILIRATDHPRPAQQRPQAGVRGRAGRRERGDLPGPADISGR
jgi:hypothetical protein